MINFKYLQGNVLKRRVYTWISFWCPVRELYRRMREEKMSFFKEFKEKNVTKGCSIIFLPLPWSVIML